LSFLNYKKTAVVMGVLLAAGLHHCYWNSLLSIRNPFSSICMRIFIFVNWTFSFAWWIGRVIYFCKWQLHVMPGRCSS